MEKLKLFSNLTDNECILAVKVNEIVDWINKDEKECKELSEVLTEPFLKDKDINKGYRDEIACCLKEYAKEKWWLDNIGRI